MKQSVEHLNDSQSYLSGVANHMKRMQHLDNYILHSLSTDHSLKSRLLPITKSIHKPSPFRRPSLPMRLPLGPNISKYSALSSSL